MAQIRAILLSLVVSILLLSSKCRKHCDPIIPEKVMIPQEILDYIDFKVGTYWVFKDSVSGSLDSSIVISSKHIMEDDMTLNDCGDEVLARQYENVIIKANKYDSLGNFIIDWEMSFNNSRKTALGVPVTVFIINNYDNFKIAYPFDRIYHTPVQTISEYKTDSITTNQLTYKELLNVKRIIDNDPNHAFDVGTWAKKIGLVHYVYFANSKQVEQSYLIRYKII
jgi:hypothetical protein